MPLLRYLVSVGCVLIGLLFWTNWYFPPTVNESSAPDMDRSIIRIHSAQRWPAAMPIDTSVPMPTIAPSAVVADNKPGALPDAPAREALAYAPPAAPPSPGKTRRRVRSAARFATRETHRRLASSQTNWFTGTW